MLFASVFGRKIHDRGERGADHYPKQLIPIEERHPNPIGLQFIVEGRPQYGDELDQQQQVPPTPSTPLLGRVIHGVPREQLNANVPYGYSSVFPEFKRGCRLTASGNGIFRKFGAARNNGWRPADRAVPLTPLFSLLFAANLQQTSAAARAGP